MSKELTRVLKLKEDLENDKITIDDIDEEDVSILTAIFKLQIAEDEARIEVIEDFLDEYKENLKTAIKYLKNKRRNS